MQMTCCRGISSPEEKFHSSISVRYNTHIISNETGRWPIISHQMLEVVPKADNTSDLHLHQLYQRHTTIKFSLSKQGI
ncbi:hypothetical protein MHBO_005265 [Bonamia ostreae]|uniref:Uncharacterized protein n=1 Tax=Bonamia ostreae TaxID=126728 RepID=A0ABV2AWQ3_9EUKA